MQRQQRSGRWNAQADDDHNIYDENMPIKSMEKYGENEEVCETDSLLWREGMF